MEHLLKTIFSHKYTVLTLKNDLNKIFLQLFSRLCCIHSSYGKQTVIKLKLIIFILLISGWEVDNLGQTHTGKNQFCSLPPVTSVLRNFM